MPELPIVRLSITELVGHFLFLGDLSKGSSSPIDLQQAQSIHKKLQHKSGAKTEVPLQFEIIRNDYCLHITGRIDIFHDTSNPKCIEEIKTHNRPLEKITTTEFEKFWAQAKCYAFCAMQTAKNELWECQLTLVQLPKQSIVKKMKHYTRKQLEEFSESLFQNVDAWFEPLLLHQKLRNQFSTHSSFPFNNLRNGQQEIIEYCNSQIAAKQNAFFEAPTGLGKTIAVLFAAFKCFGQNSIDKIFFFSSRTIGQRAALRNAEVLRKNDAFRYCQITAKEKICPQSELNCDATYCQYSEYFYHKLLLCLPEIHRGYSFSSDVIREIGEREKICPFELSLFIAELSDLVICDSNYITDYRVRFKRFFGSDSSVNDFIFLFDEAHNLPDRIRANMSPAISEFRFAEISKKIPKSAKSVHASIRKVKAIFKKQKQKFILHDVENGETYLPMELIQTIDELLSLISEFTSTKPELFESISESFFEILHFKRVAGQYCDNYCLNHFLKRNKLKLEWFCIEPVEHFTTIFLFSKSCIFFSATLQPSHLFRKMFALEPGIPFQQLDNPFPPENLQIFLEALDLRYNAREENIPRLISIINSFLQAEENALIFFGSYAFMNQVTDKLLPLENRRVFIQPGDMSENDKIQFLKEFEKADGKTIGFAVLGGHFSEAIDLVGNTLKLLVICGLGIPAPTLHSEEIREHFDAIGEGYNLAYQLPGITKCRQASGRLIRSEKDTGRLVLIDDRYFTNIGKYWGFET